MKLGRKATDTYAVLSKAYGQKLWKSQVFLSSMYGLKRACMSKSQMKMVAIIFFYIKD